MKNLQLNVLIACEKSLCACRSGKYRSRTCPELAKALAEQYSNYIINNMVEKLKHKI